MRTAVLSLAPGGIAAETITGGGIACSLRARAGPLAGVRADVRAPAVLAAAPLEVMLTNACASGGAHLLSCLPSLPSSRHRVTLPSARHCVIAISYCAVCMPFPHDREQLSFVFYYNPEFSRYSRTQYLTRDGIGVELIRQVCMDGEGVVGEGGGSQPRTSATRLRAREAQQLRRDGAGIRGSGRVPRVSGLEH